MSNEAIAEAKVKPMSKKRSTAKIKTNGICDCPEGTEPTIGSFRLPHTKEGHIVGAYCEVCSIVTAWNHQKPAKEEKAKKEPSGNSGQMTAAFQVFQVSPVKDKDDHMVFVCQKEGKLFSVTVPSTKAKVTAALKDSSLIVGKMAVLEFDGLNGHFPVNPKVKAVKTKEQAEAMLKK